MLVNTVLAKADESGSWKMSEFLFSAGDQESDVGVADDICDNLFQPNIFSLNRSPDSEVLFGDNDLTTADDNYCYRAALIPDLIVTGHVRPFPRR
jgi:hypothetical protein